MKALRVLSNVSESISGSLEEFFYRWAKVFFVFIKNPLLSNGTVFVAQNISNCFRDRCADNQRRSR